MPVPPAATSNRPITRYYESLQAFHQQGATTEGATRIAFQNLLSEFGKGRGFTIVGEQSIQLPTRRTIRVDAEVRDQLKIRRGLWEAKDTADDLDSEIRKKIAAGYPTKNIIFENTQRAVLYQDGTKALDLDITQPANLQRVLDEFFEYTEPLIEEFHQAVAAFRKEIPQLAEGLTAIIDTEKQGNKRFRAALDDFLELCRASLNPATSLDEVEDMLKQHLLTERIFRSVFNNPDFVRRNAIARELEKVVDALTSRSFSRDQFLGKLDYFYRAIEDTARTIDDYSEKQSFLHAVYEQFFQAYSTDTADTHGIVYTPRPIVRWMVASVEQALQREFGLSLSDRDVHILDPCVGTGTFMLEIMEHISPSALPHKYAHELHANEILLLPYYIAAQNIEHEFYERTGQYTAFEGIVFADTLDMAEDRQASLFSEDNTERIERQKAAPITVIIGNPPYNVGQQNENDNNKNRRYRVIDGRIRETYIRDSKATLRTQLYDAYVRFFRWATDRLQGRDGVVCYVSNNSFADQFAFDGMRKHLLQDYTDIYHLDLHGNVRKNPKLSGTTHNVFGIQVGVGITIAIRNSASSNRVLRYHRVPEMWRKTEKYGFLTETVDLTNVVWLTLHPDARYTWLTEGMQEDFESLIPMGTKEAKTKGVFEAQAIFKQYSGGVKTNRDTWVYDFEQSALVNRVQHLVENYNEEVDRWRRRSDRTVSVDDFVANDETRIKWSGDLKVELVRGTYATFSNQNIRNSLYRPFIKQYLYFDTLLNNSRYLQHLFFPTPRSEDENLAIWLKVGTEVPMFALLTNVIPDLLPQGGSQCFPFYTYDANGHNRRENITDWSLKQFQTQYGEAITKWDIFYYVYGLLHSPDYRTKYAQNLKRDLPHIPFVSAEDFAAFVVAGTRLATLHVDYEKAPEYRLRHIENRAIPWTWRVEKMRLTADKTQLIYNEALTLADIPAAVYEYRLGNRSALEWIVDQYQVKTDKRSGIVSDPNDSDDPEAIVRLIKQVVTVSLETVKIVSGLPKLEIIGAETVQGPAA